MCVPICCRFHIFNIVAQFWVYAIVFVFVWCVHVTYCVTWIYFKLIPGSEVVHEFLVLECVLKCFFVGGWVLPELQQICGVQFGSGTNPGGHVTVSFGATVIFCVDGPLEYSTPTSHISGCV